MEVSQLPIAHPKLVGYQMGNDCWIFAAQDFKPSYWLILKREGFSGDLFQASDELDEVTWQLDDYEQLANIYRLEDIPPPDAWYKWDDWLRTDLEKLILAGRIQVYKVDETVAGHLNDLDHPIYSHPDTSGNGGNPVVAVRNQLAETLGKDIMDRWVGKDKADRLHWDRSGLMRELSEVGDIGVAVYDVAADLVTGLKDIGSFVITAVKDTVTGVVDLAFDVVIAQAKFTSKLISGDFDGIKDDLLELGVMAIEEIKESFKDAKAFAAKVNEGRKIFWNLTTDAKSRRLIFDYLDSVYQSIKYEESRVIGVKIVSVVGIEVLLALATAGAGNVARRVGQAAAKGANAVKNASKIDRIGPFPINAIDQIADLGRALDKPAVKTPEAPKMTIVPENKPKTRSDTNATEPPVNNTTTTDTNTNKKTTLSGHGSHQEVNGKTTVPEGTTVTVYAEYGASISDDLGQAIETGQDVSKVYSKTYNPGDEMPNYTLHPPDSDIEIKGTPTTVDKDTNLSELLEPNMGSCDWAACTYNSSSSNKNVIYDIDGVIDAQKKEWIKVYE